MKIQRFRFNSVPSVPKVLLHPIFSNLLNLGTGRDTTKEHEMNSIDIFIALSIDFIECFFVVPLNVFKLERFETISGRNTFATDSATIVGCYHILVRFSVGIECRTYFEGCC